MRVLGIDFGDRNVGLALSDPLQITAQPLATYVLSGEPEDRRYFQDLVRRYEVGMIVLGMPIRMDGSPGRRAEKTREFGLWLEQAAGVPIVFWDERLTTRQAQGVIRGQKVRAKDKKSVENQVSASIILAGYLESRREDPVDS
jgi:putative Holliday junction resolvase